MAHAQMLDLPFAYSSNGDGFAEHDFLTGMERQFGLDEFPTEKGNYQLITKAALKLCSRAAFYNEILG